MCECRAREYIAEIQVALNIVWSSTGLYLDHCQLLTLFPSPGLPGLDHLCLQCNKWKGTWPAPFRLSLLLEAPALPRFFLLLSPILHLPWYSSEVLGNTKRTQLRGLYLSRLCDRIYEIWNRNDSKQLCLCGSISVEPTASLFHYLTWHSPTAAPAPLWIINRASSAAPFTACPFTQFSFPAPKCLIQTRYREREESKKFYVNLHLLTT